MIEEHLTDCDSCKAELQTMDDVLPINNAEQNCKEAEAVKKLSRTWKKGMLKIASERCFNHYFDYRHYCSCFILLY